MSLGTWAHGRVDTEGGWEGEGEGRYDIVLSVPIWD